MKKCTINGIKRLKKTLVVALAMIVTISTGVPVYTGTPVPFSVFAESETEQGAGEDLNTVDFNDYHEDINVSDQFIDLSSMETVDSSVSADDTDEDANVSDIDDQNEIDTSSDSNLNSSEEVLDSDDISDENDTEESHSNEVSEKTDELFTNPMDVGILFSLLENDIQLQALNLDNAEITENTTINDGTIITGSLKITGSSDENNPVVVTIQGTVTAECTITINGFVKIEGDGTNSKIIRGESNTGNLFDIKTFFDFTPLSDVNAVLTINNCNIYGNNVKAENTFNLTRDVSMKGYSNLILSGNTTIENENVSNNIINFLIDRTNGQYSLLIQDNVKIINNNANSIIGGEEGQDIYADIRISGGCITNNEVQKAPIYLTRSTMIVQTNFFSMNAGTIADNIVKEGGYSSGLYFQSYTPQKSADVKISGGTISAPQDSTLPVIYFGECYDAEDCMTPNEDGSSSVNITGLVKFEKEPENSYYYVNDDNECLLSKYSADEAKRIKLEAADNGTLLSTDPFNFGKSGEDVTVTYRADSGYRADSLYYYQDNDNTKNRINIFDTSTPTTAEDGTSEVTFTMPDYPITLYGEFGIDEPHYISVGQITNGELQLTDYDASKGKYIYDLVKVKAIPEFGYVLTDLKARYTDEAYNEQIIEPEFQEDGTWMFRMPAADVTIAAEFESLLEHNIKICDAEGNTVISGGIITAKQSRDVDDQIFDCNGKGYSTYKITLTPEPENGYALSSISVNEITDIADLVSGRSPIPVDKNADGTYTFIMPDNNVEVIAKFTRIAGEGTGTSADPYLISTLEEFESFRDAVNSGENFENQYFKLKNDIYLTKGTEWTPIGSSSTKCFSGNFDGDGYSVNNILITSGNNKGLFGYISGGTVENLTVSGSIEVTNYGGGITANLIDGTVKNCINAAEVRGNYSGGIVGMALGTVNIENCSNLGNINGGARCGGGIIASAESGAIEVTVKNCINKADVSNGSPGGGIIGRVTVPFVIDNCANTGNIYGSNAGCGGLVGTAGAGTIKNSYNTGNVEEETRTAGGLVGAGGANIDFNDCYSSGAIAGFTGTYYLAQTGKSVTNCYYIGSASEGNEMGTAVSESDLKALSGITLIGFSQDSQNINNGFPILDWQNTGAEVKSYTVKISANGDAANGVKSYIQDIGNGIPAEGIAYNEGLINIFLELTSDYTSKYTIGNAYIKDKDFIDCKFEDAILNGVRYKKISFMLNDGAVNNGIAEIIVETRVLGSEDNSMGNVEAAAPVAQPVPSSYVWDGKTVDMSWFNPAEYASTTDYYISTPQQLMGLAALVNGLVNEDCELYLWEGHGLATIDDSTNKVLASTWNSSDYVWHSIQSGSGGNGENLSTENYAYGCLKDQNKPIDFNGKTIHIQNDLDMGGIYSSGNWSGPNYMPIGGAYLMSGTSSTKISSSFNGTFDGGGNYVFNIYCERHVSGNYGDGSAVGLIGRIGSHDNDPASWRPDAPAVKNVGVTGYISSNRSVGGVVGKIGKTNSGATISGYVNYATVVGTDAKGTGGIVGASWNGGTVENCHNMGTVTGGWPAGGISGSNEVTIRNCYNVGYVSSAYGKSYGMSITTGGIVSNTYYRENTSSSNGGVYGSGESIEKTSAEMRTAEFVTALNGSGNAFVQDTSMYNQGYPILAWQESKGPVKNQDSSASDADLARIIIVVSGSEGTVKLDKSEANVGETVTITITPNKGYEVDTVTVKDESGKEVEVTKNEDGTYSFVKPEKSVTVTVTYKESGEKTEEELPATEIKAEVIVEDGKASATVTDEFIADTIAKAIEDKSGAISINATVDGEDAESVTSTTVTITQQAAENIKEAQLSLEVKTSNGTLNIPAEAMKAVSSDLTVNFTANEDGSTSIGIKDGENDAKLSTYIKASVAVNTEELMKSGSVVYLVKADGTEDIIPYSMVSDDNALCILDGSATIKIKDNSKNFGDVSGEAWYKDSIDFVTSREMFRGTSENIFNPTGNMTRGMIVQVLMNIEKGSAVAAGEFGDVAPDAWYAEPIAWAVSMGIVNGTGNGNFSPNNNVTREQMAVMLYNYANKMNYRIRSSEAELDRFSDAENISSWADEALNWAVGAGIFNGNADGTLNPKGNATRAQVATIMQNFTKSLLNTR